MGRGGQPDERRISTWKKALAGASAGVVCCAVFSPLDVARTRLQVQGVAAHASDSPRYRGIVGTLSRILRDEGIRGWFRGFVPAILTVPLFWSLYFPLYDTLKLSSARALGTDNQAVEVHMLAAIGAGFTINIVANPLYVVRTRLQTQSLHGEAGLGMAAIVRSILRREGWRSFYRGLGASTIGLSHIAIQFPVYEWLKRRLTPVSSRAGEQGLGREQQPPTWAVLAASCVSKLLASTATYPHELVRARLQDQRTPLNSHAQGTLSGMHKQVGILEMVAHTVRREGVPALWNGFSVNLVRVVPQSMITFALYEWLIWTL